MAKRKTIQRGNDEADKSNAPPQRRSKRSDHGPSIVPIPPALYLDGQFLASDLELFRRDHDPCALLRTFVNAMDLGIYPPVAILHNIKMVFQAVLDGKGKKKLDVLFGLARKGQGAWNAVTQQNSRRRQYWLASTIYMLVTYYKLTEAQAAERVSLYLESQPGMKVYTAEALTQQYSRTWKSKFRLNAMPLPYPLHPPSWPLVMQAAFFKQFPDPALTD